MYIIIFSLIETAYPKIITCGGWDLSLPKRYSQELEVPAVDETSSYTPSLIYGATNIKQLIYIRPMQADIAIQVSPTKRYLHRTHTSQQSFSLKMLLLHSALHEMESIFFISFKTLTSFNVIYLKAQSREYHKLL